MNTFPLESLRPVITGSRKITVRPSEHASPHQHVRRALTVPELVLGPQQLFLTGQLLPGWKLMQPLPLALERDADGKFIVSENIVAVYGVGESAPAALDDYRLSLVEYYEILARHHDGPSQGLLRHLQQYLQPE